MNKVKLSVPHNCYLILTANCNMRCLHCYGSYGCDIPKNELSGEEWINVIKDLSSNGIFFVNISGGEPTVHKDFTKIIESLVKNEMYFMLTTNGLFNNKIKQAIIDAKDYVLGIQISLDGPDWLSHGYLRKDCNGNSSKDIFDTTLNNIVDLIGENIRVSIATCLHKENIRKIDELKKLILKIKPSNWSLSTISISGRARENDYLYISESTLPNSCWLKLKNDCLEKNIEVNFIDMPNILKDNESSKIYYECPAAKWFCEIYSDGSTTPCPLSRVNTFDRNIKWDNIREMDIKRIWDGIPFNSFREYQKIGCEGCTAIDKCDRCPPQSIQWFNDPLMPPPYCIENGKNLCLKDLDKLKRKLEIAKKKNGRYDYGIKEDKDDIFKKIC